MVNRMSGPPPETTLDRTQTKDTYAVPEYRSKFLEGRDSTDHATSTDMTALAYSIRLNITSPSVQTDLLCSVKSLAYLLTQE